MNTDMIDFEIDGNTLKIKFVGDKEDRQELIDMNESLGSNQVFREITEGFWTNGWGVHTADQLNQMSDCLVVCEDSSTEDDGSITLHGKAFTNIHNYQVYSPIETLIEEGIVEFYLWDNFDGENFPVPTYR